MKAYTFVQIQLHPVCHTLKSGFGVDDINIQTNQINLWGHLHFSTSKKQIQRAHASFGGSFLKVLVTR